MLEMTELDTMDVWNIVKNERLSLISENTELGCNTQKTLLSYRKITVIVNSLADKLEVSSTILPNRTISEETLKTAAEMFTYLNYRPPKLLSLISNIFKTRTTREILFALTSIQKNSKNAEKDVATELLSKFMKYFGLNQFENIQIITKGNCNNNSRCTQKIDVMNKDDMKVLGSSDSVNSNLTL